jgi:amino acid permease
LHGFSKEYWAKEPLLFPYLGKVRAFLLSRKGKTEVFSFFISSPRLNKGDNFMECRKKSRTHSGYQEVKLERSLKPIHLWSLAVGLVISGNYFGWITVSERATNGLAIATIPVIIFYLTFIFCYSELATMIPHAGGPSAFARRAMGPFGDI